ncbi:MAG TPA: GNAT family N-acetyltransferase [Rudaea sp.]|jgi:phosphinothricin acetyltransferase
MPGAPSLRIRAATETDAAALLAIYAPYVAHTAVSFETQVPDIDEFTGRVRRYAAQWAWLVAEHDERIVGYAYGSPHRGRAAYRWSTETSAYVDASVQRQGVGKALYLALFEVLAARGYCQAFAGMTLPNDASVALHRSVGFEPIGVFRAIGYKFGAWHDVAWAQRRLRDGPPPA